MHGVPLNLDQIKRDFRGEVRVFPQPNVVLFPDGFAPVKVFEERYVELLRDAAEDDKLVAMALLQPGWESEYTADPPVFPNVCIGHLLQYRPTPKGKCEGLLYGLFRGRIVREVDSFPYRRAEVELLDEVAGPTDSEVIARRVRRALDLVPGRKSIIWEMRRMATQLRGVSAAPGRYADAVADASDLHPGDRYELLSEPNVLRRLERLIEMLESRAYTGAPSVPPGTRPDLN